MTLVEHLGDFTSRASGQPVPKYYGEALVELARANPNVVALSGDLSSATEADLFLEAFPDRFFKPGIAEANMIGLAAGMARMGMMPFVHTFSCFMSRRAFDQVAMQLAYPRTNVKMAGFLPGLTTLLGVSHQAIEDNAMMRALPNMTLIEPCGAAQMASALRAAADVDGPVYMRLHRPEAPMADGAEELPLEVGKGLVMRGGADAVIFASGHMVGEALKAVKALAASGTEVAVVNIHSLKPLDTDLICEMASRCGVVLTAENHSVIGGLGSAVAETLMEAGIIAKFARIGVCDQFAEGGSTAYLFEKYGLSSRHIEARISQLLDQNS